MQTVKLPKLGTGSPALDGFLVGMLLALVTLVSAWSQIGPVAPWHNARPFAAKPAVVPPDAVPDVEPIQYRAMSPADARLFNASIPFSSEANPPAHRFTFAGGAEDRLRALDCLTAAVLYEAGDDPDGQRAVAQVVLNRVRHPAFPRTVCGVVFQGAERSTGCQFTFTCDGALTRTLPEPLWERAGRIAAAALAGFVYKPVGEATHYHTDWVVPYWSSSLDKIVAVHTHLFFRWTGWWGTPPAFRFNATGIEPRIAQLAYRFPEHASAGEDLAAATVGTQPSAISKGLTATPSADNPNAFLVLLSPADAANFAEIAAFTCGARPTCKFMGWTDLAKLPHDTANKLTAEQLASLSFSYLREKSLNMERALWNCGEFKRAPSECLWSKSAPAPAKPSPISTPGAPPAVPAPLQGVHFKDEHHPTPRT